MNEELNYPIQYAVLEIKEKCGYIVGYKDIIRGYIVSKCYVSKNEIEHFKDGTKKITHRVVFPFKNYTGFKQSLQRQKTYYPQKRVPSYDARGCCDPVDIVSDLFDCYEKAKVLATSKNKELEENIIAFGNEQSKKQFEEELAICQMFEQIVQEQTEDMSISELSVEIPQKTKVFTNNQNGLIVSKIYKKRIEK